MDSGPVELDISRLIGTCALIQANSGDGKSTLLRLFCGEGRKARSLYHSWEGEFVTLREKVDAVLVGTDGEIPTDIRSAGLLARKLIEPPPDLDAVYRPS